MVKKQFLFFLFTLALCSFFAYQLYNPLPTNAIFEVVVLLAFVLVAKKMYSEAWFILVACLLYLLYTFIYAYLHGVHVADYFLAYKTFIYIIFLCFFSAKVFFEQEKVKYYFNVILIVFLLKYVLWLAIASFNRPGVFAENNFEIMFILFWALAVWSIDGKLSVLQWSLLTAVVFLSGSRSGVISYFAMMAFLLIRTFDWRTLLKMLLLALIGGGAAFVFMSRLGDSGDVTTIDRFVFFQGMVIAMQEWHWVDFFTGSPPVTALPDAVCERLAYYKTLFSAKDPTVCYSVILHSYLLRVFFDHGILGFLFVFLAINILLKLSNVPSRARLSVLAILFLNGLSVSSINSVYAMLGLIVLMTTYYGSKVVLVDNKALQGS